MEKGPELLIGKPSDYGMTEEEADELEKKIHHALVEYARSGKWQSNKPWLKRIIEYFREDNGENDE